jgi:hypothetical protein
MFVAGPQDLFIATETGKVLRLRGSTWTTYDTGVVSYMNGIWGTSASNIYAVGGGGTIVHFDGSTLVVDNVEATAWFQGIFGLGTGAAYACGSDGMIVRSTKN